MKIKRHARLLTQIGFFALTNSNFRGFVEGSIYTGDSKLVCVPGLNCYSCPGARGACPIGSLQAVTGSRNFQFSYYVVGFLLVTGAALGRFVCGWLCPFGLVEDLLYKIPFFGKRRLLPGDRWLKYLKYAVLALFVLLLPALVVDVFGEGAPWFCKWICPSGTLFAGVPLYLGSEGIREAAGGLFLWKIGLLSAIVVLSLWTWRPFCRYLCPLGAIYGLFNPISLYSLGVDSAKCTRCGACKHACKFDIDPVQTPNSPECVRCGACKHACPHGAIRTGFCVRGKRKL